MLPQASCSELTVANYDPEHHSCTDSVRSQQFAESLRLHDRIVVALDTHHVCGHLILRGCHDCWDIIDLSIDYRYRRRGLATSLIDKVQRQLAGCTVFLEVAENNQAAISLYRCCGFIPAGIRSNYYHNDIDALVMRWQN